MLFFVEIRPRRVHVCGSTTKPEAAWVTQQARNISMTLMDRAEPIHFLVRDRDSKFTGPFDEVFSSEGATVIKTPYRSPRANAHAERFVGTARESASTTS